MIFRSDFVTNSSSSSYLAFNVKNRKLWDYLSGLGFDFDNSQPEDDDPDFEPFEDGVFSDGTIITLPSGIKGFLNWEEVPDVLGIRSFKTISEWIIHVIEEGYNWFDADTVDEDDDIRDYDDRTWKYSEAEKELSEVLDPDRILEISDMEDNIEYASIEFEDCDECGYNACERIEVKGGTRTIEFPQEGLWRGIELEEYDAENNGGNPGEIITQKWENGCWVTQS